MLKTILKLLPGFALLIALQACAGVASPPPTIDPNAVKTVIAQTSIAAATQTAQVGVPITGGGSLTPTPTPLMTTPIATVSPAPAFTATSPGTQVSVSVATNCRAGPGIAYPRVGGLLVGQVAEVVGRNSDNTYLIIRNPDGSGTLCWLWGQFATLTGNPGALPVFTPPPPPPPTVTPTPAITLTPIPATVSPTPPTPSPAPTTTPTP